MHIVGLAAIIGPYLVQWRLEKRFEVRVMLAGTIAQLVTGVGLVIVRGANERDITPGMVAVKLFVTVLIAAASGALMVAAAGVLRILQLRRRVKRDRHG